MLVSVVPSAACPVPVQPYVDYFTHETMVHPLTNKPTPKRSFVPSKWENQKVGCYVCMGTVCSA